MNPPSMLSSDSVSHRPRPSVIWLLFGVLLFVTLFFLGYVINSARSELSDKAIADLYLYIICAVVLQVVILYILFKVVSKLSVFKDKLKAVISTLLGGVLTINLISIVLLHMPQFSSSELPIKITVFAILFFVLLTAFSALSTNLKAALPGFVVSIAVAMATYVLGIASTKSTSGDDLQVSTTETVVSPMAEKLRNVYFISWDAMVPASLAKEFMDLADPAYIAALKKNQVRFMKNGFSNEANTKDTMASLLSLHESVYRTFPDDVRHKYFSGRAPSLVSQFLKKHGYKSQSIYGTAYLGKSQGEYIDFLGIAKEEEGVCDHVNSGVFLGYCKGTLSRLYRSTTRKFGNNVSLNGASYPDYLFERVKKTAADNTPWFTIAHIYMPGHTAKDFRKNKAADRLAFREYFEKRSRIAAQQIENLFITLNKYDPNAIVMISGDHGAFVSRGVKLNKNTRLPRNKKHWPFFIQDNHGIVIAVWPENVCPNDLRPIEDKGYAVNTDVARALLKCAVGGDDPLNGELKFTVPNVKPRDRENIKLEDYIYE